MSDAPKRRIRIKLIEASRKPGDEGSVPQLCDEVMALEREAQSRLDPPSEEVATASTAALDSSVSLVSSPEDQALTRRIIEENSGFLRELAAGVHDVKSGLDGAVQGVERCTNEIGRTAYGTMSRAIDALLELKAKGEEWMPTRRGWVTLVIEIVVGSSLKG